MGEWSGLPDEAIVAIAEHLPDGVDYTRFRSICHSWRAPTRTKPRRPCLILERMDPTHTRSDYNYVGDKLFSHHRSMEIYTLPAPDRPILRLPADLTRGRLICGCSRGWIALLQDPPAISLHNPFSNAGIDLPLLTHITLTRQIVTTPWEPTPFTNHGIYSANKAVLSSSDPTDPNCHFMALSFGGMGLIHCRPSGGGWAQLSPPGKPLIFTDLIFYDGSFYAVCEYRVFVCHISPDARVEEISPTAFERRATPDISYLVVSSGNLLLAAFRKSNHSFVVYHIDLESRTRMNLVRMANLGGRALFFSPNSMSVSISADDATWCKANCIYLCCNEHPLEFSYINWYNLEDHNVGLLTDIKHNRWGPNWLTPNLNDVQREEEEVVKQVSNAEDKIMEMLSQSLFKNEQGDDIY